MSCRIVLVSSIALIISACDSTDSSNVRTSGISADIVVETEGNGSTTITAQFTVGSGGLSSTVLELEDGDQATASTTSNNVTLSEDRSILNDFSYVGTINEDTEGTEFTVALDRPEGNSAPNSTATLPEAFEITSPSNNDTVNISDDVTLQWSPSGFAGSGDFSINYSVTCPTTSGTAGRSSRQTISDDGAFVVSITDAVGTASDDSNGNPCDLEIKLTRTENGSLDPNYGEGGSIVARQVRTLDLNVDVE